MARCWWVSETMTCREDRRGGQGGAPLVELTAAPRCDIEREIWLVVHPDVRRSPRVQRVADAIAEAVRAADGRL